MIPPEKLLEFKVETNWKLMLSMSDRNREIL
jgi:hypothetical protein